MRKDARIVGEAIQAQLIAPWLRRKFPDRPVCSVFDFDAEPAPTASEVLDDAVKARQAGYEIDAKELSEKTGYTLKAAPQAPAPGGFGGGGLALNRKTPLQFGCDPLQNARKPSDGEPTPPEPAPALKRVLEAFRSDLGPAAEELQRVLALPEAEMREACKDLADRLPDLLPADPAMASVLSEELAGAFAEAAGETAQSREDAVVKNGECRARDPAHCPVHGTPREHRDKGFQDRYGNGNPEFLVANPEANIERGKAVFTRLARKQTGFERRSGQPESLQRPERKTERADLSGRTRRRPHSRQASRSRAVSGRYASIRRNVPRHRQQNETTGGKEDFGDTRKQCRHLVEVSRRSTSYH